MTPFGDRRGGVRLEVIGSVRGTLAVMRQARLINVSLGGVLIASSVPLAVESAAMVQLTIENYDLTLEARVRHVSRTSAPEDGSFSYLIGMEFLEAPDALAHALQ